jgi:predicted O-linked N-acetylglucosamine transferase (SPINDLY family)
MLAAGRAREAAAMLGSHRDAAQASEAALGVLGMALELAGQRDEAIARTREAIAVGAAQARTDPALLTNLGAMLSAQGEHAEAIDLMMRARTLAPSSLEPVMGLASVLRAAGRYADALAALRPAMASGPGGQVPRDPRILMTAADLLWDVGRTDQAAPLLAAAVRLAPADPRLATLAANLHNYLPTSAAESLAAHRRAAALLAGSMPAIAPERRAAGSRPLRVGLLSADLREHSCAYFLQPLLDNVDPERVRVFAYLTLDKYDGFSERVGARCAAFRRVHGQSPADLAAIIRADQLDVLVETDGFAPNHSLAAVSLRPAPRIATWLGYPNTTGLGAVDARIVDSVTDPEGADAACSERLVRLDRCFVCYQPPAVAPDVGPRPAAAVGAVTFGCFNTLFKFTRQTLTTYAGVLRAVPGSTLLIKNKPCGDPGVARDLALRFKECGIDPARVRCEGWKTGRNEHLEAYNRVDIALDSMPYCGATTTCEAMFMGVPVVTLRGAAHAGRVGASLLKAIGAEDLVCNSADEFVVVAAGLARDLVGLAARRAGLRRRLLASSLCDGAAFARSFTDAIEEIAWG